MTLDPKQQRDGKGGFKRKKGEDQRALEIARPRAGLGRINQRRFQGQLWCHTCSMALNLFRS